MIVPESVLFQRLKRVLKFEGLQLHRYRGKRWFTDLGRYYVTNDYNLVDSSHIELEVWGRELGVIRKEDKLAETEFEAKDLV